MSMWLNLVKLPTAEVARIRSDEAAIESLFFSPEGDEGDAEGGTSDDFFGTDYRTLSAIAEALGLDLEDGESWLSRSLGNGAGDCLAYEFCYGPGYVLGVDDVKAIAVGFAGEEWYAEVIGIDDDENLPGLVRFFEKAAAESKAILGGVS